MLRNRPLLRDRKKQDSFALIAALGLIAVATLLLVLFVSVASQDRSASYSYSQSVRADQIGQGALRLIVEQLQGEMSKDALPDSNFTAPSYAPVYTNLYSTNIQPQANVTNTAIPTLVKMSVGGNVPFFTSTAAVPTGTSTLIASSISTTAPSVNGRSVSLNVWNNAYFGTYANNAVAPNWVLITRNGPSSGAGLNLGPGATTANNPVGANNNYVLGRMAYAVYDESGLLDVTVAGYPGTGSSNPLTTAQIAQIKGTMAGVDLSQIPGITSPSAFINWRNSGSDTSGANFVSYVNSFASTNGFRQVYPGDSTFLSRQDLIGAALNGTAGLSTTALPYLTTFTREVNAPSWTPSVTVPAAVTSTRYKYTANYANLTGTPFSTTTDKQNPNPYIPLVRYKTGGSVTDYRSDGTSYSYTVNAGDPVVQHRFPLDRLSWITPSGPATGISTAAIQACFGLYWGPSENIQVDPNWTGVNVWRYVGSVGTATSATKELKAPQANNPTAGLAPIETLADIANEASPRQPNFFELLQAGVLSGSLALTVSSSSLQAAGESYPALHLLRIGANILSQVQTQPYPITIEYNQTDAGNFSVDAIGIANLPYISMLKFITGVSTKDTATPPGTHQMGVYGMIQLWNPHQQPLGGINNRPPLALFVQGGVSVGSGWSMGQPGYSTLQNGIYGKSYTLGLSAPTPAPFYLTLSNGAGVGANGFLNPYPITSLDKVTETPSVTATTPGWTSATGTFVASTDAESPYLTLAGATYEALELPDLTVNLTESSPPTGGVSNFATHDDVYLGNLGSPYATLPYFQMILKFKDPSGVWVPYDYFTTYNYPSSWTPQFTLKDVYLDATAISAPPTLEAVLHGAHTVGGFHSAEILTTDPRTQRLGSFNFVTDKPGDIYNGTIESDWAGNALGNAANPNTSPPFVQSGYASGSGTGLPSEGGVYPNNFYCPADTSRNNISLANGGANAGAYFSAYSDPDGIQRIGDSGLFSTSSIFPFAYPPSTGNPYYDPYEVPIPSGTASHRTADRPIILNRPFASVGELGYVFRDDPWRTLDFSSVYNNAAAGYNNISTSADSGLLDLFTVTDSPNTVVAGRVNLNTSNAAVLSAILGGTLANAGDTANNSSITYLSNPSGMAAALTNYTKGTAPLVNKDQLVTGFGPTLGAGTSVNTVFANQDEQNVKPYREAYVRALADVGQTRTWNLMIDLIAQSGKYPPSLTTGGLDQFQVDGERHYWLHVAIDRVTGKVVDRQLELIGQ